jgi:hypothetical protein
MRRAVFLVAAVFLAAACSGGEPESTKYLQTWTKAYGETTCTDWHQTMSAHERFVMAADMLLGAHRRENADAAIPSDILVTRFEMGIGGACADAGEQSGIKVSEVAALLYTMSNDLGPESP